MTSQPKRWRQFGLRDLAWLMLVVALSVGWYVEHMRRRQAESESARYARDLSEVHAAWQKYVDDAQALSRHLQESELQKR